MTLRQWKLTWCDMYRDGGSLAAVFSCGAEYQAAFVKVASWSVPAQRLLYRKLWISIGQDPGPHGVEILPGSPREDEWLRLIRGVDLSGASSDSIARFEEFVAAAINRQG